jgi:hypothetical protein
LSHLPRRSGRLSVAREAAAEAQHESTQCSAVGVINNQHPENPTVGSRMPKERSSETIVPSKKPTKQERQIKRPRSLGVMSPHLHVAKKTSRRLDDEFEDIPTIRDRSNYCKNKDDQREGLSQEHYNLALTNFEPTKYTSGFSPYDVSNRGDVLQSPEYVSDIFQRLFHSEVRFFLNARMTLDGELT